VAKFAIAFVFGYCNLASGFAEAGIDIGLFVDRSVPGMRSKRDYSLLSGEAVYHISDLLELC
jgi:hypothetical protein